MSAFAYSCTVVPRSCPGCDWLAWGGGFLGVAAADTRAPRAWLVAIHTSSGRSQPAAARPMGMQRTSAARNKLRRRRRGRAYGDEMMTHGSLCNPHRRATLSRIMTRSVGQRASTTDLADSCACSCGGELAVRAWHRRRGSGARMRTLCARRGGAGDERRRCAPGAASSRPRPACWASSLARRPGTGCPRPPSLPPASWLSTFLLQAASPLAAWPATSRPVAFWPVAFGPQASWPEVPLAAESWAPAFRRPSSALTLGRV